MNILYCSNVISKRKFEELFKKSLSKPNIAVNKFHNLFLEGFSSMTNNKITSISVLPINRRVNRTVFWKKEKEEINGIKYIYMPFINISILRQIFILIFSIYECFNWKRSIDEEKSFIITDSLNIFISLGALVMSKVIKVPIITIVTDLPEYLSNNSKKGIYYKLFYYSIKKYNGYVFLTEEMNKKLNVDKKPYLIIEGLVDKNMNIREGNIGLKNNSRSVTYAGGLYERYGIETLIKAFMEIEGNDITLDLYGDGDLVKKIKNYSTKDSRIKYHGIVENNLIIEKEMEATLLVNPRPISEEFTKYSFPSKNMEYMVSGTPILTTKLPGMPREYYSYVYLINEDNKEGIKKALIDVLSKSDKELFLKGKRAKEFVIKFKSNVIQSSRIIDFIGEI